MKPTLLLITLLSILTFQWDEISAQNTKYSPDVLKRIEKVENNLLSSVQIPDTLKWSIESRMQHYNVPGLSIAVINNYSIEWAKGYGMADISENRPVTNQTLFQAASISKSLNSIGVLYLVQKKQLSLDADINEYLNDWKFPYDSSKTNNKKITVANLLSHTAGLSVHGFPGYAVNEQLPSLKDILDGKKPANTQPVRSLFEPGKRFQYSGGGVEILQTIVTDVTHEPYDKFMWDHVLKPLGMENSSFTQPPPDRIRNILATGYRENGKELEGKYHIYPEQAAAGLWTNPTELCKYIIDNQLVFQGKKGKVLTPEMTKLRLTPYDGYQSGFGVFIEKKNSTAYFSHSGANEGFRCIYIGSMDEGKGVAVMVNSDNGNILSEVVNSVASVYKWKDFYNPEIKEVIIIPDSLKYKYNGHYDIAGRPIIISLKDDAMILEYLNMKTIMYFTSNTEFFLTELPGNNKFIINSKGKVTGFFINGNMIVRKLD